MSTTKLKAAVEGTLAMTSLNSLASDTSAGLLVASSIKFDNTSGGPSGGLYLDVIPSVTISYPNSAPTVAYMTFYYAALVNSGWEDDGYSDAVDGTDQTVTIGAPTGLKYAGTVPVLQNKISAAIKLLSVASVYGFVPPAFCVIGHNGTGQTLNSSGHALAYSATAAEST